VAQVTEVEFHTGVGDKLAFACRLLRKAYRRGARVAVSGPAPLLAALDRALWVDDAHDFLPHIRVLAGAALPAAAARTPIWLIDGEVPDGAPGVRINLGAPMAADLANCTRIIEVLSTDADDAQQGRQRWRDYKARGLNIVHHSAAPGS
jgi:DNA polymerase III subunit chi